MMKILVAEDDQVTREAMEEILRAAGYEVDTAADGEQACERVSQQIYDLVITDLNMPRRDGLAVLQTAQKVAPETRVMMVTAYGKVETAVEAMKQGAADFLTKPLSVEELELKVRKILEESRLRREKQLLQDEVDKNFSFEGIVSENAGMQEVFRMIGQVAATASCVLITGESGTGKELVARAIHANSRRKDRPFVTVNCAALAEGVLESELFGHEKGAFTGALQQRKGRFEMADTGTLFLDEVGDIPLPVQVKLLRVVQEKRFERVGGNQPLSVDVRIIAATNQDLSQRIQEGRFREDLYYRLNVVPIQILPLRERAGDIPVLARHFLEKYNRQLNKGIRGIDPGAFRKLADYDWPGNVRELENIIERIVVLNQSTQITAADIPELKTRGTALGGGTSLDQQKSTIEKEAIREALEKAGGKQTRAAQILGIDRTTLRYRMKKYVLL